MAKVGGEAGAKAGRKFGFKVGRSAGLKAGEEWGAIFGREDGGKAATAEAYKAFVIGITKDRVAALKKLFVEVGEKAGTEAGMTRDQSYKTIFVCNL